jgi:hypothetical protein
MFLRLSFVYEFHFQLRSSVDANINKKICEIAISSYYLE